MKSMRHHIRGKAIEDAHDHLQHITTLTLRTNVAQQVRSDHTEMAFNGIYWGMLQYIDQRWRTPTQ